MVIIQTCIPPRLPLHGLNWEKVVPFLGPAYSALGHFNADIEKLSVQSRHRIIKKEAIATLLAQPPDAQNMDRYIKVIEDLPKFKRTFSLRLLLEMHHRLNPDGGKIRKIQNWIGPEGCSVEDAYFYAPKARYLKKYCRELTSYAHSPDKDLLIQLAVIFAQLLIIHPFLDGNGRVARLYIPLYLYQKKLAREPLFFLSSYFQKHRKLYFELLFNVSTEESWEDWIVFFLKGVSSSWETPKR